jgi:hypothetical protein
MKIDTIRNAEKEQNDKQDKEGCSSDNSALTPWQFLAFCHWTTRLMMKINDCGTQYQGHQHDVDGRTPQGVPYSRRGNSGIDVHNTKSCGLSVGYLSDLSESGRQLHGTYLVLLGWI